MVRLITLLRVPPITSPCRPISSLMVKKCVKMMWRVMRMPVQQYTAVEWYCRLRYLVTSRMEKSSRPQDHVLEINSSAVSCMSENLSSGLTLSVRLCLPSWLVMVTITQLIIFLATKSSSYCGRNDYEA